jgi:hypothetical protein
MKKIEVISINGGEVPYDNVELNGELESNDIYTHCQNTIFRVNKEDMPHTYAWLVKEGVIEESQALTWKDKITCCMWGD